MRHEACMTPCWARGAGAEEARRETQGGRQARPVPGAWLRGAPSRSCVCPASCDAHASLSLSLTHTHTHSLSLSLSLSLSHTHTHTHSHSLTLSHSHTHSVRVVLTPTGLRDAGSRRLRSKRCSREQQGGTAGERFGGDDAAAAHGTRSRASGCRAWRLRCGAQNASARGPRTAA